MCPAAAESHRRMVVSCSEGCTIMFHQPTCWRAFKEAFKANHNHAFEDFKVGWWLVVGDGLVVRG